MARSGSVPLDPSYPRWVAAFFIKQRMQPGDFFRLPPWLRDDLVLGYEAGCVRARNRLKKWRVGLSWYRVGDPWSISLTGPLNRKYAPGRCRGKCGLVRGGRKEVKR